MISDSFYRNKFEILFPFIEGICKDAKKEIKQDYIRKNRFFLKEKDLEFEGVLRFFSKKIN